MAFTQFTTSNVATKKVWTEDVWRNTQKKAFLSPLIGKGSNSCIIEKTELNKQKGDVVYINNITAVDAGKVLVGGLLDVRGNAQSLSNYRDSVTLDQYDLPTAFKRQGSIDYQRVVFDIDDETQAQLEDAGASVMDDMLFTALYTSPTRTVYAGSATSAATLTANDKITPERISFLKTIALSGDRDATDARVYEPLKPIKIGGKEYLVLMVPHDVVYDFKRNSEWLQASREAQDRGSENPIFKSADAIWDSVIIMAADRVPMYRNGGAGSDVPYAKCMLLGAGSLLFASSGRPQVEMDYDKLNKISYYNWTALMGSKKTQFNSKDWGCIQFLCARTKVMDRAL